MAAFALAIAWNRSRVESIQRLEALKAKSLREFSTLASQVAHDIRSPLAALEMIIKGATTLPEEQRLLVRSATSRIRDIANNLLNQNKAESPMPEPVSHQHISALVDLIITEKRIQFRIRSKIEIEVHEQALALFAKVAPSEFKRVLSNLINNSVEALDRGRVSVSIRSTDQNVLVEVRDSGRGIPPEILAKLGQHGISHGKVGTESGSGLGIAHAKKSVENWGGRLEIESEMGKGTAITLFLPKVEAPKWFRPEVTIGNKIPVVVDDDLSILRVWEGRFAPLNIRNHLHFISAESFCDWLDNELNRDGYIFFFDYELLGSSKTGLDLIEKYSLASQSVLVTSHFEEKDIQERAGCLGVGLLPKGLVAFVPIHGSQPKATAYDAVLLDDDKLTHQTWEIAAKSKKKSLRCFVSSQQLFAKLSEIDPSTPFYIDSNLSAGEPRGEEVAKMLFERGYRTLYLATGYEAVDFRDMPWLCAIVGKGPPWIS